MSSIMDASEFENPCEAYKTAKARQARIDELVKIRCTPEERDEIIGALDDDRDDEVANGDVCEMWGTTHTQDGSYEWRVHLIPA